MAAHWYTWIRPMNKDKHKPFDDKDFKELFEEFYEPLCRYGVRFTRDPEAAEDIVQEVFVYIWEHRKRLQPVISLKAYLFTSVKNRSLNYLRKYPSRKSNLEICEQEEGTALNAPPDPHKVLENKELVELLHKGLESLPERCRTIFHLKKFAGMSHREISEALHISEKTIEAQITIAGKKLNRFFSQYLKTWILLLLAFLIF